MTTPTRIPWSQVKILLVQIREEIEAIEQEEQCFMRSMNLEQHQFVRFNVITDLYEATTLDGIHAVVIGGAGAFSATKEQPFYPTLRELVDEVYERELPMWGSCWGHQYLGRHFGGNVEFDEDNFEFGTFDIHLTEAGKNDPIFSCFPNTFDVQQAHQDQVKTLPSVCELMATNTASPVQSFKVKGKPIYTSQFHPEMSGTDMRERMLVYKAYYPFKSEEEFQEAFDGINESEHGPGLLMRFMRYYVAYEEFIAG